MRRREFVVTSLFITSGWPLVSGAQPKVPRIGFLGGGSAAVASKPIEALRIGLRELGYIEGKTIAIEYRWADGQQERATVLAKDLVRQDVQLIVAWTTIAALAVKRATTTIPVSIVGIGDPVGTGLVASLSHPGGNITGLSNQDVGLTTKRLELLKQVFPKLSRLAVLRNPTDPNSALQKGQIELAVQSLGMELRFFDVLHVNEYESAFVAMVKARVDALTALAGAMFISHGRQIADLALKNRLPSVFARSENVEAGGLMSYGASLTDQFKRTAVFIDKILRGAKPADLPVEQASNFALVINRRTARQLGLSIPADMLIRADGVIE